MHTDTPGSGTYPAVVSATQGTTMTIEITQPAPVKSHVGRNTKIAGAAAGTITGAAVVRFVGGPETPLLAIGLFAAGTGIAGALTATIAGSMHQAGINPVITGLTTTVGIPAVIYGVGMLGLSVLERTSFGAILGVLTVAGIVGGAAGGLAGTIAAVSSD